MDIGHGKLKLKKLNLHVHSSYIKKSSTLYCVSRRRKDSHEIKGIGNGDIDAISTQ